jgi:hypothetical protein
VVDENKSYQKSRAVVTDTAKDFYRLLKESNMVDWFGQIDVTKMSWAFIHGFIASLALFFRINDSLSGIHKPTQFRLATFINVRMYYATFCDRHSSDFVWTQDAKLDFFHQPDGGFRV